MIKVKHSIQELNNFANHLEYCVSSGPKTIDLTKEYLLACSLDSLVKRIRKKVLQAEIDRKFFTPLTIKIENPEILALSIYFGRYELPSYMKVIEHNVLSNVPSEIINILRPKQNDY